MTKRLLVALLVAVVVAGTVSTAFAASFSDTKGTKYEGAVGILSSLGILNGFPDGTFKPGDTITRAQFAKIAVCGLGLEGAAEYAKGVTMFSDVPATHWAAGYINVAADQGLIKGFPDGTFHPDSPVTYAEVMAVIVRMLGYDPMVKGAWPTNYLVKAAEIGVSTGLTFAAGAPATRGDVALLLENSLDINLMVQATAGDLIQYVISDDTLLDKLGYWSDTGWVTQTAEVFDSGLEPDEVVFDGDVCQLAEGVNLDAQLGLEVQAWFNDDDEIVFAKTLTKASDIIRGVIEDITDNGQEIEIGNKTYDGHWIFDGLWNLIVIDSLFINADDPRFEGAEATLVLDEGHVAFLNAIQFDGSVVISDVNTKYERFDSWDDEGDNVRFDVDDYDEARFIQGGEAIDLEDLVELDVAHFFEVFDGAAYLYLELVDEKVSGELEEVSVDADDVVIATVDGEDYALADDATLSADDNDTIVAATEDGMEDFVGNDVELYLNRDGDARHIVGDFVAESESVVGLVKTEFYVVDSVDPTEDDQYFVKLFKYDGSTTKCEITEDTEFDGVPVVLGDISTGGGDDYDLAYPVGTFFEFSLDADGALAEVDEVDEDWTTTFDESDIDGDRNLLCDERVTSGTKIVDIGEWEVVPWATFQTATFGSDCNGAAGFDGDDITLEYFVFDSTGHGMNYDVAVENTGVVLSRKVTADGVAVKVLIEDEDATYNVGDIDPDDALADSNEGAATEVWSDVDVGDLVTFEFEDDEFTWLYEEYPYDVWDLTAHWVEDVDEDNLIVAIRDTEDPEGANTFDLLLEDDCVIYDVTGTPVQAELSDLAVDQVIQPFCTDGDELIEIIKIVE